MELSHAGHTSQRDEYNVYPYAAVLPEEVSSCDSEGPKNESTLNDDESKNSEQTLYTEECLSNEDSNDELETSQECSNYDSDRSKEW